MTPEREALIQSVKHRLEEIGVHDNDIPLLIFELVGVKQLLIIRSYPDRCPTFQIQNPLDGYNGMWKE